MICNANRHENKSINVITTVTKLFVFFFVKPNNKKDCPPQQVYTRTGDETRKVLTDSCVNTVYNRAKGYFSNTQWAQGITVMLKEYT